MKKVVLGSFLIVAGSLLFCLLQMAQLSLKNPTINYIWVFGPILVVLGLILGFIGLRRESIIPVIASSFSVAPFLLFLFMWIPFIGIAFAYLFFGSYWGLGFCLVGFVLGLLSLYKGIKYKRTGIILSIIAILAPFGWMLH